MVMVQVADLSHENFKSSRVMRWWLSRLSSRFGAKSSRERKPKWLPGLTRNSRSGIPGNFWNSGGNYGEFIGVLSFFPIFIVDYDILLFNLTHCIMCTTHDRLTAFWAKTLNVIFDPTFCVYRVPVYFQILISKRRKITEQRQNFANSDRYTNEDAEILIGHRPRFFIHRPGMEGVLIIRKVF